MKVSNNLTIENVPKKATGETRREVVEHAIVVVGI